MTEIESAPPQANASHGVDVQRRVRQIARAIKATNKFMFWDVNIDEDDISDRFNKALRDGYTEREAMESAVEGVLMSHEDWLRDAVGDQCRQATRVALGKLPNVKNQAREPSGLNATKTP